MLTARTAASTTPTSTPVLWDTWWPRAGSCVCFLLVPVWLIRAEKSLIKCSLGTKTWKSSYCSLHFYLTSTSLQPLLSEKLHLFYFGDIWDELFNISFFMMKHFVVWHKQSEGFLFLTDHREHLWTVDPWRWKNLHPHHLHLGPDDPNQLDCEGTIDRFCAFEPTGAVCTRNNKNDQIEKCLRCSECKTIVWN